MVNNLLIPPTTLTSVCKAYKLTSFLGAIYAAFPSSLPSSLPSSPSSMHPSPPTSAPSSPAPAFVPVATPQQLGAGSTSVSSFLSSPNITIFVPRDIAISLVGGSLTSLSPYDLARLVAYHLVPGVVVGSDKLLNGTVLSSAALNRDGSGRRMDLHVRRDGNNLFVNSAQVVQTDVLIANGVLHILDNVLSADAEWAAPVPNLAHQPPVFPIGAAPTSAATGLPFTTALPCTTSGCPVTSTASDLATRSLKMGVPTSSVSKDGAAAAGCSSVPLVEVLGIGLVVGAGVGLGAVG